MKKNKTLNKLKNPYIPFDFKKIELTRLNSVTIKTYEGIPVKGVHIKWECDGENGGIEISNRLFMTMIYKFLHRSNL